MADPIVYLNGDWIPASEARISVFDRGFLFGDGVFETGRLHRGRYFRLEQHLARLEKSASFLRLPVPPLDQLLAIGHGLAERNAFAEGSLRITVTRGSGGRGLSRAGAGPTTVVATLSGVPVDWEAKAALGWRIRISSVRRPPTESTPPQLKGLGRPYALLAHYEAEDDGLDDALLLSADGLIAEGPTWNLFWRKDQTVFTPALAAGILEGVTRGIIIDLARAAGYQVEEGCWQRGVLDSADEVFATMTSNGVVPITQLDQRPLHQRTLATSLQTEYWKLVRSELGQKE